MPKSKLKNTSTKITPTEDEWGSGFITTSPGITAFADTEAGELSVDVFQTADAIVVVAPIAGVRARDLIIEVTEGVLKISGARSYRFTVEERDYVSQECFWGNFKRSIILPEYVDAAGIRATFKNCILTIRIPKIEPVRTRMVQIKEE